MKSWHDSDVFDIEANFSGDYDEDVDYDEPFLDDIFAKPHCGSNNNLKKGASKLKSNEINKTQQTKIIPPRTAKASPLPTGGAATDTALLPTSKPVSKTSNSKKKQKKKAKKIVDKMAEREPDLFDDPVLWETRDRKKILGEEVPGEVDAFWGGGEERVQGGIFEGCEKDQLDKETREVEIKEATTQIDDFM